MIRLPRTELPPPSIRLDGPRAFVRPPAPADFRAWADVRERSRTFLAPWEPLWAPDALSEQTYQRRLRRQGAEWRADEGYNFHVFDRKTGQLVGGIGLTNVHRGVAQTGALGYWVGEPFARQGYTSEAVKLVVRFAFATLGLHRVEAACVPENDPSRALLEKVGFVREGYARAYLKIAGTWRDHFTFAILDSDPLPDL
jgi:[ribosomal protein S5]-alanine N-acetyltransferase